MNPRKLRIAFSITCVIACLVILVWWARSARTVDFLQWNRTRYGSGVAVTSFRGRCEFMFASYNEVWTGMKAGFTSKSTRTTKWDWEKNALFGFGIYNAPGGHHFLSVPHWFLLLTFGFLAAVPWLPTRLVLRILVATATITAGAMILSNVLNRF
jgi:hypothetical protein